MSGFTVEFEFEIGDLVYFRGASHNATQTPIAFCITERFGQECHAGVQRLYKLSGNKHLVAEVALTDKMPPYQPADPGRQAEAVENEAALREASRSSWREMVERDKPSGKQGRAADSS